MDYKREARELVCNLQQRISPSPYDIGWMGRLRAPDGSPRWPNLIDWLLDNQHSDGSWGGAIVYYHDRIISTLSALIALKRNGFNRPAQEAIQRGEKYIWQHLHLLAHDLFELVGFELLLPTLLVEAQLLGLNVPPHTCGYGEVQNEKLRLIPLEMLYSPRASTVFSIEFLGRTPDKERLRNLLGSDGSVGTSPSATAYYLTNFPDATPAWEYLDGVYNAYRYAPFVYPFRTFDLVWVLNSLRYSGQPLTDFATADHWAALQNALTPQGISSDPAFLVADGDSTSVTLRILLEAGMAIDPQILAAFQDSKTLLFRTYAFERNISISTNVHALETLYRLRQFPELAATRDSILTALMRRLTYDMYWTDKWNASPYYVTSHAIVAFLETDSARAFTCLPSIEWILHTQKDNGGWGYFQATTAEETAYALIALLHYHQHHRLHDVDVLHKAADYLIQYLDSPAQESPPLYIGKVLFAPYDIVRASVLASLIRYTDTFGRLL